MKRIFRIWSVLMVLALLASASAMGEDMTPVAFLAARGLMVMDQNQLASLSGEDTGAEELNIGVDMCGIAFDGDSPAIYMVYQGTMYIGFDLSATFGGGEGMGKAGMAQVFADLCDAFEFPLYICGDMVFAPDTDTIMALLDQIDGAEKVPENIYHDKAEFIADIMASVQ